MQTPTYVAKKIGDHYEIVDKNSMDKMAGMTLLAGGTVLGLLGMRRGGIKGLVYGLLGGYLFHLATNRSELVAKKKTGRRDRATHLRGPSYQNERRGITQKPEDKLQEASMESFPASDAPAKSAST